MGTEARSEDELWAKAGQEFERELQERLLLVESMEPLANSILRIWEETPDNEAALAIIAAELGIKTPRERVESWASAKATPTPEDDAIEEALEP